MDREVIIHLENISKTYKIHQRGDTIRGKIAAFFAGENVTTLEALKNVNLEIYKGEMFGIIGHNGCGKSTLIQVINQSIYPNRGGKVSTKGKCMRLALDMGFNPELTARQNIYLSCSVLGLTKKEINDRFAEIISFAELDDFIDTPAKYFSSGMKSKLMFSIAVNAEADIFLMDEFFGGVGDVNFKKKANSLFHDRIVNGKTIVIVSHNLEDIRKYCDRVMLVDKGQLVKIGPPDEMIKLYREMKN